MTSHFNVSKYQPFRPVSLPDRTWPDQTITVAPAWCSVDLRDGNQALIEPMTPQQKLDLWNLLLDVGFKEIEIGFPSASSLDYDFCRKLIDESLVPDDVTIQVLTQARPDLIEKTFAALKGARRAVVHVYNSTSTVQRDYVFGLDRAGIVEIATQGAQWVADEAAKHPNTEWIFEYSPESFTGTELDFAVEVVDAVTAVWSPTPQSPVIINLPATVEMSTPNVYADQIEWFCRYVKHRDSLIISVHTHNDRGCAVAASELAVLAGADRVEGTLFGNGERTGNMDILTMAMNLYSQGVDPNLNFERIDHIIEVYKSATQLPVHPRHPYAGELVFTAFSGSHQDAIKKCLAKRDINEPWEVAYLPIDPRDIGRSYQEVIRINSQSGKGGIAYVLEQEYGYQLPRWLQIDFSPVVQRYAESSEKEVDAATIQRLLTETYFTEKTRMSLGDYTVARRDGADYLQAVLQCQSEPVQIAGSGNGVVAAFVEALEGVTGANIVVVEYSEHALSQSAQAEAICYIQLNVDGQRVCGIGRSEDIIQASLEGILRALDRSELQIKVAA
ncbi:MAG: 2-isopropylmalate synthase [Proteobacteria bacterium]|jgi:2-isopropylmalate synthase|nr:2-isopropylmalate synthase [Pseudomonadota bacterium]HBZ49657.1 2-isopropylmalate synthase [Halieaceae bacterium]